MSKAGLGKTNPLFILLVVVGLVIGLVFMVRGCSPEPQPNPTITPTVTQQPSPSATPASPKTTATATARPTVTQTHTATATATQPAPPPTTEPAQVAYVLTGYQPGWLFMRQGPSPKAWAFDWLPEGLAVRVVECYYTPYPWALVYRLGPSGWPAFWPEGPGYVYAPYLSPDPCPEK